MKPVGAWCHQLFKCVVGDDDDLGDGGCHSGVHQKTMEKKHHVFFFDEVFIPNQKTFELCDACCTTHTHTYMQSAQTKKRHVFLAAAIFRS